MSGIHFYLIYAMKHEYACCSKNHVVNLYISGDERCFILGGGGGGGRVIHKIVGHVSALRPLSEVLVIF